MKNATLLFVIYNESKHTADCERKWEQKCITIIKINFTNFVYEWTVLVETQCRLQFQGVEV